MLQSENAMPCFVRRRIADGLRSLVVDEQVAKLFCSWHIPQYICSVCGGGLSEHKQVSGVWVRGALASVGIVQGFHLVRQHAPRAAAFHFQQSVSAQIPTQILEILVLRDLPFHACLIVYFVEGSRYAFP